MMMRINAMEKSMVRFCFTRFQCVFLQSFPLFFSPESQIQKKKIYIYSYKFFYNFHLSESGFTCFGQVGQRKDCLYVYIYVRYIFLQEKRQDYQVGLGVIRKTYFVHASQLKENIVQIRFNCDQLKLVKQNLSSNFKGSNMIYYLKKY